MDERAHRDVLIYGAYGCTGRLVTAEAGRRGLRTVLAGRRREPLEAVELAVRVERGEAPAGFQTPAMAFGPDLPVEMGWRERTDEKSFKGTNEEDS